MDTTIGQPVDKTASRGPQHRSAKVIPEVIKLAALGLERDEIADQLGMTGGRHGGLAKALRRQGFRDLLAVITPTDFASAQRLDAATVIADAAARVDEQAPDATEVGRRLLEILKERYEGADSPAVELAAPGRRVRGPGGIVRWVAA